MWTGSECSSWKRQNWVKQTNCLGDCHWKEPSKYRNWLGLNKSLVLHVRLCQQRHQELPWQQSMAKEYFTLLIFAKYVLVSMLYNLPLLWKRIQEIWKNWQQYLAGYWPQILVIFISKVVIQRNESAKGALSLVLNRFSSHYSQACKMLAWQCFQSLRQWIQAVPGTKVYPDYWQGSQDYLYFANELNW